MEKRMIRVDETDPVGEIEPSFPYRDVTIRRGVEFKDHYDIQSEIGRGKFGTVYRCKEKSNGLQLAAKVVSTVKKEDRRAVEREVEIMRRLQHPRLIQLYDAIDTGQQFYVILELIEGGELFERVIDDDFVLTERSCAVFMRQICEGIEFIHAQNILHLDLKPENILCLTKEGNRIKIIDFGLAREYDPKKKLQVLFGTPEFVAPEVVNFDQIGFGTDMWSIGVICYVLLSGLSPFMGDTDIETMANVTIAKYDFDHDAFTDISEEAKDFIRCLLIKDKDKRMTAAQCREHRWLAREPKNQRHEQRPSTADKKIKTDAEIVRILPVQDHNKDELDMTKDNLRLFVERWREHPDSPYMIDFPQCMLPKQSAICDQDEWVSLQAHSPSSRDSISSSFSETTGSSPRENHGFFLSPSNLSLSLERRASESTATEKPRADPVSQIALAEEIIKLSEHLRSIAMGTNTLEDMQTLENKKLAQKAVGERAEKITRRSEVSRNGNGHLTSNGYPPSENTEYNEIAEKLSNITKHRKMNGTTFHSTRSFERRTELNSENLFASLKRTKTVSGGRFSETKDKQEASKRCEEKLNSTVISASNSLRIPEVKEIEMDLTPPWRRPRVKHLFGETSRDVPRISTLRNLHKDLNLDEPTSTKNLLLYLLEEWEDVATRPSGVGRKSVSVDWCGEESVARKTINSLAEYFQSKQQKPTSPDVPSSPLPSIHR